MGSAVNINKIYIHTLSFMSVVIKQDGSVTTNINETVTYMLDYLITKVEKTAIQIIKKQS